MSVPDRRDHDQNDEGRSSDEEELIEAVGEKEERKVRAQRRRGTGLPWGLGAFGLVGWSVMVPTVLGVALGVWLDARLGGPIPWTLTGLVVGLTLGCLNAWYWVSREQRDIERERDGHRGG